MESAGTETTQTTGRPPVAASTSSPGILAVTRHLHLGRLWHLGPILPERMRRTRRPRLWQEIVFIGLSYWVYSLIRDAVPTHQKIAFGHADSVLNFEKSIHVNIELSLNHFVDTLRLDGVHWLAYGADYYYAVVHFVIVVAVLVWVYVAYPKNYRGARTAFYAMNALAAIVFWLYPLAPPRLLTAPHFGDTLVLFHTWGSLASGGVSQISNQFAAMPSLHIGWSLWAGITVFMLARRWWLRVLGLAYPVVTFFVIIGTANHFVLDAAGGVVVLAAGFFVQRLLTGRPAYANTPDPAARVSPSPAPGPTVPTRH